MSAPVEPLAPVQPSPLAPAERGWGEGVALLPDQFIASYGKGGGLGCFAALEDMLLARGERVVLQTPRGLEMGAILGGATLRQARLLGAQTSGTIVRRFEAADAVLQDVHRRGADELFDLSRRLIHEKALAVQVLDVEVLLDGAHAIVHLAARGEHGLVELAEELSERCGLQVHFESASAPADDHEEHAHGGCGKPDCGKAEGGGCSSCGAGGCSSCGTGPVDLKPYFGHLRERMEAETRTSLL